MRQIVTKMLSTLRIGIGSGLKKTGKILSTIAYSPFRMIARLWNWIVSLFVDEQVITIWVDPMKKTEYHFRYVETLTPTNIKGKLITGEKFEIRTQEKFNYQVKQVK